MHVPLWLKLGWTALVLVIVPVYWIYYGPQNFLWFSDIALVGTCVALWLESRLLASMMLLAAALPELAWNLDFFARLLVGAQPVGLTAYMFDPDLPLGLRALSLFHILLLPTLLWLVWRLGYDRRAWLAQTALAWLVLPATYLLTDPADNINWVFGPGEQPQTWMPPGLYLLLLMALLPLIVYLPVHLVLRRWLAQPASIDGRHETV